MRFLSSDGQPGSYAQDGLSESQGSAVNRGTMYLKIDAASASGNGRLQRSRNNRSLSSECSPFIQPLQSSEISSSADPLRRCSLDRCVGRVGRSWSNANNSLVPRFSPVPDMGLINGCTNLCTKTSLRCPMKPTVADSRTPDRLVLCGPAGDLCHGRGRGFESRRSRQFFESAPHLFVKTSQAKLLRVFC